MNKLRNLLLILLLFLPVLAVNYGFREVTRIRNRWAKLEQQRFANQKLGELSANFDLPLNIANRAAEFKDKCTSLFRELPDDKLSAYDWAGLHQSQFNKPFPASELWFFSSQKSENNGQLIYSSEQRGSRRPMEMLISHMLKLNADSTIPDHEFRRNEKMLQRTFGSGSDGYLLANDQRGVATPVIYNSIPSWLLWDYQQIDEKITIGFFIIVRRNQNLEKAVAQMAGHSAGLGESLPGGFLRIFESASTDYLFSQSLQNNHQFQQWRNELGFGETRRYEWEVGGFPWQLKIGADYLYTRILPAEHHLAFLLLPSPEIPTTPDWLYALNWFSLAAAVLIWMRGILLGVWPFSSISGRFIVVYLLAVSLAGVLYITSATAYVYERIKSEENHLDEMLKTSLRDFDAGKEFLESDYRAAFTSMLRDSQLQSILQRHSLKQPEQLTDRVYELARNSEIQLPLAGISIYDLEGNFIYSAKGSIRSKDFETIAGFYGVPLTMNIRNLFTEENPDETLPPQIINEKLKGAFQSYARGNEGLDKELERFRSKPFRTDSGHSQLVYMHDYIGIENQSRYVLLIAWLDSDINEIILARNALMLGIRAPQVKLMGLERTPAGTRQVLTPDRSISSRQQHLMQSVADAAFSIGSGFIETVEDDLSIVAYASPHFPSTVLVAAIDHFDMNTNHLLRIIALSVTGIFALLVMLCSILTVGARLVAPLKRIKRALDDVKNGNYDFVPEAERCDEIGLLNREFASMMSGLKERQRLSTILSQQAVEAISEANGEVSLAAKELDAIVLISDIRSFTTMCEQYEPSVITELLNDHFSAMAAIVSSFGGRIYKFIGDAIEVVFIEEASAALPAAARAVAAAQAMIIAHDKLCASRELDGKHSYKIGIGLAKGPVIAGENGSRETRLDYAMLGAVFKTAEKLENHTRNFLECPIIADESVKQASMLSQELWAEETCEGTTAYRLIKISETAISEAETEYDAVSEREPIATSNNNNQPVDWLASLTKYRRIAFLMGILCMLFVFAGYYISQNARTLALRELNQKKAENISQNLIARLNVPNLEAMMLEEYLDILSEDIPNSLPWNTQGTDRQSLKSAGKVMLDSLNNVGLTPETLAILHKPGGHKNRIATNTWNHVVYTGPPHHEHIYSELLRKFAEFFYNRSGWPDIAKLRPQLPSILGTAPEAMYLHEEMFAKVTPIKRGGADQLFYWQSLFIKNPEAIKTITENFSVETIKKLSKRSNIRLVGNLMCIIDRNKLEANSLELIKQVLLKNSIEFAFVSETGHKYRTASFPFSESSIRMQGQLQDDRWSVSETLIKIKDGRYRFFIAKQIDQVAKPGKFVELSVLLFFVLSFLWYRAIYHEGNLARSFVWQLWLGLFMASAVLMSSIYVINEWYAIEQKTAGFATERMSIINLFNELERRQFLQETVAWDKLSDISTDPEVMELTRRANSDTDPQIKKKLVQRIKYLAIFNEDKTRRMRFNEMMVCSNHGWQQEVYPQNVLARETREFKRFIEVFINTLFEDLGTFEGASDSQSLGTAVKGEMTKDALLELFRTMFGTNMYFRAVHGPDLKIPILASSGIAFIKLIPVPGLEKPDIIYFWLFIDSLNSAMGRVFKNVETGYPIFAEPKTMYGKFKHVNTNIFFPEILRTVRWSLAANSPLSTHASLAGNDCLVEARISTHNTAMFTTGLASEKKIISQIESTRKTFLLMLLGLVIIIVILALLVSADIAGPVSRLTKATRKISQRRYEFRLPHTRNDELGDMMRTFNSMARWLQEKELMNTMVSNSARQIASDDESLKLAEAGRRIKVAVLYLTVPSFDMFSATMSANELMEELRKQTSLLCHIILRNSGDIDKVMGEKLMAVFYNTQEATAVSKALSALKQIRNEELTGNLGFPITAGIHYGQVIAGLLGVGSQRDFTIIGDTVNTAARICASAANLPRERFLVSAEITAQCHIKDLEFRQFGSVDLKGKAEQIELYQPVF